MLQNLNEKSNKESHYKAIKLQSRFNYAISRICEYYFIDRQDKTNTLSGGFTCGLLCIGSKNT
jgi:hypothetical protein